ncbi:MULTISPECIES: hypothetical protein [unclassified Mesorhizobium]|uniref:lipase/acyltransferase domain-containing protein n=1 Tax=unclassified Mesorhizobium TaxID=325217 RepID=UPI000FCC95D2|nr:MULTISPECIES: hypothetical protein [unclassified Mesorhizobium]RUX96316.1 hypothetical protein EN993_08130 [Mesorhizobium sp. M7D.F.Ca.US.004.01.2.1]RVA24521.1 hypothetical protein EN935_25935 [Mesorhizobium sp. M7D.F.Ca.US.004.03.1.1]
MIIRTILVIAAIILAQLLVASDESSAATGEKNLEPSQAYSENIAVIFLPGIFGSKLTCTAAGKYKDALIWGDGHYGGDGLSLEDCPTAKAELLGRAEVNNMSGFWKRLFGRLAGNFSDLNVYSNFKDNLSFSTDAAVLSFPYDWRRSNAASASDFDDYICSEFSEKKYKKYIFVAHSMGGLVLDAWIKTSFAKSEKCKDGSPMPIDIKQVSYFIFGGTPFLGAPEVVTSMFSGDNSMTRDRYFRMLFGDTLIEDAITFDSVYELIPFTSIMKSDCKAYQANQTKRIIEKVSVTGDRSIMNLSLVNTWQQMSIPRRFPESLKANEYEYIGKKIESASNVVCERLSEDVGEPIRAKYRYVVGKLRKDNTFENTTAVLGSATLNQSKVEFQTTLGQGDGTVPEWSAMNGIGTSEMNQPSQNTHDHIYDDISIMSYLQNSVSSTASAIGLIQKIGSENIDKEQFDKYIEDSSEYAGFLDNDSYAELAKSLSDAAQRSGIDATDIYRYSRGNSLPDAQRALGFSVAAYSVGLNDRSKAFSWINSAELNFKMNNPSRSWFLSQKGLADPASQAVNDDQLQARLNSILGKSRLYLGDYGGFDDLDNAADAGWVKAGENKAAIAKRVGVDLYLDSASIRTMAPRT